MKLALRHAYYKIRTQRAERGCMCVGCNLLIGPALSRGFGARLALAAGRCCVCAGANGKSSIWGAAKASLSGTQDEAWYCKLALHSPPESQHQPEWVCSTSSGLGSRESNICRSQLILRREYSFVCHFMPSKSVKMRCSSRASLNILN